MERTPLLRALDAYACQDPARFHMPGHKGLGGPFFRPDWDVTELAGLDDLLSPEGVLEQEQQEAAQAFGAGATFFCTGGSTTGVLAMLLSLEPGGAVVLQRGCHRSAWNGLALSGHRAVCLWPADGEEVSPAALEALLAQTPDARAVLLTRPDYYGRCFDGEAVAAVCHAHGALLLVDEAHGAHLAFSPLLPQSAAAFGDCWVQSAHKTLRCPNQGAYLHCADPGRAEGLRRALFTLHTTSPAYPLLAALATAWREAQSWDYDAQLQRLREAVASLPPGITGMGGLPSQSRDGSRLVLDVAGRGLSGYAADGYLRAHGVYMELAEQERLVAITSPLDPEEWYKKLLAALWDLPENGTIKPSTPPTPPPRPPVVCTPREAMLGAFVRLPPAQCVGRVAAEAVGLYPPGVALVAPGELYTEESAAFLTRQLALGHHCFGLREGCASVCAQRF